MRRLPRSVSMGVLLLVLAPGTGRGQNQTEAPLASALHPGVASGDFEFYVDAAAIGPADSGRVVLRVLLQFPLQQFLETTKKNAAELHVLALAYEASRALEVLAAQHQRPDSAADDADARRERAEESDQAMSALLESFGDISPHTRVEARPRLAAPDRADLAVTDYQLAEIYLEMPPGDHLLEVQVENLSRLKKGLFDKLRQRHLFATARLLVQLPDLAAQPALADPVFLAGHGTPQQYAARVYGLLNDSLHVRTSIWVDGAARLDAAAHDRSGEVHWRDSLFVSTPGRHDLAFHTSVNPLPAGQYVLTLTVQTPTAQATVRRSFDVAWSLASWKKSRRALDFEAETILTEEEHRVYGNLPLGEKERYLDAFWQRHDPTPETADNELQLEFEHRVAYADAHFSESIRGALTHRGKVFIRFGMPNEIQSESLPGHLAGAGAEALIEKVEDPYSSADEEAMGVSAPSETQNSRSGAEQAHLVSEAQRVVGPARELIGYELWIYNGRGAPLLPRDVIGLDAGFRLLFLDNQGFGQYLLRKSSATLDIPGLPASY
ncbi:MAG TPA: GWxTD domain-containing protein [Candidatus Krumholzibacteria bacterium]|nr:GWxTD domain-containing protein [Candidatus Krumholzibacteria bacterium]